MKTLPSPMPPGPWMTPWRLYQLVMNPIAFMEYCTRQFGDVYYVRALSPLVMFCSQEAIQQILTADPDAYDPFGGSEVEVILGSGSLLRLSGARHRAERKILMPPFHGSRMRAYGEQIAASSLQYADRWASGTPFDIQKTTQAISLDVIIRAVFGAQTPDRVLKYHQAVGAVVGALNPALVFFPSLRHPFYGVGPWARFRTAMDVLWGLLYEDIDRRGSDAEGGDILSQLTRARYDDGQPPSRDGMRDELLTLLFAGHETTAVALAWAFYFSATQDGPRQRLLEEIDSLGAQPDPDAIAALPYLDAFCLEILRIRPVVPIVGRVLRQPMTIQGYSLPSGLSVALPMAYLHRRPDLYPQPETFRPERFLDRPFSPFEFLPFGGGHRRCIGAAFAVYEMKVVIATILGRYVLEWRGRRPPVVTRRNLTLGPKGGIQMAAAPR